LAVPPGNYRINRMEVWQYYAVNRQGLFRPLVVYTPFGAYYRYNGQPFPWAETHQREWMPYAPDDEAH
jgi:hypothetical protein